MTVVEFLSMLRSRDIQVWAEQGKLRFRAPHGSLTPRIERELRQRKEEILRFVTAAGQLRAAAAAPAVAASHARHYPLSFAQQRMWFVQQMHPGNAAYNVHTVARLHGPLNVEAIDAALTAVVNRHDALRTTFRVVDAAPVQVVGPPWQHAVALTDLAHLTNQEQENAVRRIAVEESTRVFDLENGPLLSVRLVRLSATEHVWIESFHHLIVDDWSMRIITREWMTLYSVFKRGGRPSLPPLAIQFPHIAAWQRERLQGAALAAELEYWKRELGEQLAVLELATDHPRPTVQSFAGAQTRRLLPPELLERVTRWSAAHDATLFMTLLTAYYVTLSTYSGQTAIVVGSPIAGRTLPESELVVGCCLGVVILRADLSGNPSCAELLARVRRTCLDAYAHPDPPFEELLRELKIARDPRRNSVFQTMFALLNTPLEVRLRFDDITAEVTDFHNKTAKTDFSVTAIETAEGLLLLADYCSGLFDERTADNMLRTFARALEAIIETPDRRVQQLDLTDEDQRRQIAAWSAAPAVNAWAGPVHTRIAERAVETPRAVAVQLASETLTYSELEARSNRLAQHLVGRGVGPETIAAIFMPRSIDLVVAILAVLKTGGAYLPLDSSMPEERAAFILADSGAALVLTTAELRDHLRGSRIPAIVVDAERAALARHPAVPPATASSDPESLAYVIYTSGSTGQPKGVCITHRSLSNYTASAIKLYEMSAADRVLQFASIGFDTMVEEVFPCLAAGGTLVLRTDAVLASADAFVDACRAWRISVASLPTAYWARTVGELAAAGRSFPSCTRLVILGGEEATPTSVQLWESGVKGSAALMNTYGPTETTVIVAALKLPSNAPTAPDKIPIGRPIGGVQLHILNADLRAVPIGAPGELCVGGDALARGYLRRPDLTAEKFVPNPFGAPGARLYRTGDLARYLPDGNIEFLGRTDDQVKIRGYRVELREIEALLARHPGVRQAVVLAHKSDDGGVQLAAYIVARQEPPTASDLRAFLKQSLPEYMIPVAFHALSTLPHTSSGKVDKAALKGAGDPLPEDPASLVAPRTPAEERLAAIWRAVLGCGEIGVFDDFYDRGGHSLLIAQLLSRVRTELGVPLPLRTFLEGRTIAAMAAALDDHCTDRVPSVIVLAAEASLDAEISAAGRQWAARPPNSVFLTGATGFLGTYLAHALLRHGTTAVHALVKCRTAAEGHARLRDRLSRAGLWADAFQQRLIVVPGDLASLRFGWDEQTFDRIAEQVDAVYHNGAAVDMLSPFRALRAANVGGTREALRLASRGSLKPVHFVSTLAVRALEGRGETAADVSSGYDQTKWVAEELVRRAGASGVPVSIFRPSAIGADTRTGVCNPGDFFHRFVRGCIAFGAAPDVGMSFDLVPVDVVAREIVDRSLHESAIGRTFEIESERPLALRELVAHLSACGFQVPSEEYRRWRARLRDAVGDHPLAALEPLFPDAPDEARERPLEPPQIPSSSGHVRIACAPPTQASIRACLTYLARQGLLATASILAATGCSR